MRTHTLAALICLFVSTTFAAAQQGRPPSVPDNPPRASLITVSGPDASGNVLVSGGAGTVAGGSVVVLITLNTGNFARVQAAADGSFTGSIFATPGGSILIKSDPTGFYIQRLFQNPDGFSVPQDLAPLAGTIIRVPDAASTGGAVSFSASGDTNYAELPQLPIWELDGTVNSTSLQPSGTLRVQGTLKVLSNSVGSVTGTMQATMYVGLERLTAPDGTGVQARDTLSSTVMTPTGLPIERVEPIHNNITIPPVFAQKASYTLAKASANSATVAVDVSVPIPSTALAGYYRPFVGFTFTGLPQEDPPAGTFIAFDRPRRRPWVFTLAGADYLPIVKIGSPAAPRLFFHLLTDNFSNGTRGVGAVEDRNKFGLASRILTQSETFVIPRNDQTGQPIKYRLEPFAPTIAISDRAYPVNPPLVPFQFPSGGLTVQVQKPDGTVDTIGPAPFVQSRQRGLVDVNGTMIDNGGGHITDPYQLSTMDSRFDYQFTQDGKHVITVTGTIADIWGNTWTGGGTYEVNVAQTLSLDTAVLPMMQFEVGDTFDTGLTLSPPVPADIQVRFRMAPNSDPAQMTDRTVSGTANRFGYFHIPGSGISLNQQGEYRVDITASYRDSQGNLWMGSRTWGGVVAPKTSTIVVHGRRGINGAPPSLSPQQWFFRSQTGLGPQSGTHMPFPFNSGDVTWMQKSDASIPLISLQDPAGTITSLMNGRAFPTLESPQLQFSQAVAVGEAPLYSSRPDSGDVNLDPSKVDLWEYAYKSVQRPLVRVREEITEEQAGAGPYWRFGEEYANQVGVGLSGDLPNDIKFQYGGAVIRGSAAGTPKYGIYGSLFVLISDNDTRGGTRTFPPFQGNGGGPTGGPIMTLKGKDIDIFFHSTGVRPGSVLEVGDTFALAGAVGPTLAGTVSTTITKPSGKTVRLSGKANKVGYYYRPGDDFVVDEPGIYTVDLSVIYDGTTSAGQLTQPFPRGDVLGTANGRFYVYVVPKGGPALSVDLQDLATINPLNVVANASAPPGMTITAGHMTATMPGFVLQTNDLSPSGNSLSYRPDFTSLARDFPNLDTAPPADLVTMTIFGSGVDDSGKPAFAAKIVDLHGATVFNPSVDRTVSFGSGDRAGTSLTSGGGGSSVVTGFGRIHPTVGSTSPAGLAIFGFRQNGVLVTEAAVPASAAVTAGRIFAEINGPVNTGLAIANPNGTAANVSFYFTDQSGQNFKNGGTTLPPNGKIAAFLDQAPFNGGSSVVGTFTFTSDVPVAVVALRGLVNERGEFLITTLPVSALTGGTSDPLIFPHYADGGGWSSQVVLVNPGDTTLTGTVTFVPDSGTGTTSSYSIPARSSQVVKTAGTATTVQSGWVRVSPASGSKSPAGLGIFSFKANGVTVAQAGVGSSPASAAVRVYAEASGGSAQIQTGIAVANSSSSAATVNFELTTLAGVSTGLTGSISVPANGHTATFLGQIQGFANLATPFQGVLRISSTSSGISITGLRGRYNERGDFLITTTAPVDESAAASSAELFFPHLADAGGYTTQFILFSGSANQTTSGTLQFYTSDGQPLNLTLR